MDSVGLIRRLHQHRMWVNQRLLSSAWQLNDEQLRQPFDIGQGAVWKTLTHLMAAEFVWLEAILGNDSPVMPGDVSGKLPGNQEGTGIITSLEDLAVRWSKLDERWVNYLANLDSGSLDDVVYKVSTSSGMGKRIGTRRADVLLHLCTHAQYTTAQLVNMLRQLGVSPLPDVMLISLARDKATT